MPSPHARLSPSRVAVLHISRFFRNNERYTLEEIVKSNALNGQNISGNAVFYSFHDSEKNQTVHAFYPCADDDNAYPDSISLGVALRRYSSALDGVNNPAKKQILSIPICTTKFSRKHWLELSIVIHNGKVICTLTDSQREGYFYPVKYIQNAVRDAFGNKVEFQYNYLGQQSILNLRDCGYYFLENSQCTIDEKENNKSLAISDELYEQYIGEFNDWIKADNAEDIDKMIPFMPGHELSKQLTTKVKTKTVEQEVESFFTIERDEIQEMDKDFVEISRDINEVSQDNRGVSPSSLENSNKLLASLLEAEEKEVEDLTNGNFWIQSISDHNLPGVGELKRLKSDLTISASDDIISSIFGTVENRVEIAEDKIEIAEDKIEVAEDKIEVAESKVDAAAQDVSVIIPITKHSQDLQPSKTQKVESDVTVTTEQSTGLLQAPIQPLSSASREKMVEELNQYINSRSSRIFWLFHNKQGLTEEKVANAKELKERLGNEALTIISVKALIEEAISLNQASEIKYSKSYLRGSGRFAAMMNDFIDIVEEKENTLTINNS